MGILIYNKLDYQKNEWFANRLVSCAKDHGLELHTVLKEDMLLGIYDGKFVAKVGTNRIATPDFVINRTRDSIIAEHFELMGSRVYNNSQVCRVCNDKQQTHLLVNSSSVQSCDMIIADASTLDICFIDIDFPLIVKSASGHGGEQVHMAADESELKQCIAQCGDRKILLQQYCPSSGEDVRVFVLGGKIIGAVLRRASHGFKSNISLGGQSEKYLLSQTQTEIVEKICRLLAFDYVGIDFILSSDGRFLFNEIEDAVGSRSLYKSLDMDAAAMLLEYIAQQQK